MIARDELAGYLDNYLSCSQFNDYAPNGLQVEGRLKIQRICTAVTASSDVIAKACDLKADALLVHHGFFWKGESPVVVGMKQRRLSSLLQYQLNLFGYHLPLDCHLEVGNNACLGRLFNLGNIKTHTAGKTPNLVWSGTFQTPLTVADCSQRLANILQREPLCVGGREQLIQSVAWCSGGAQDFIEDAYHLGVDAYISGEISERTFYQAHELGLYYFSCGHHATERYGIQALGRHLAERFDLQHTFIDSHNPV